VERILLTRQLKRGCSVSLAVAGAMLNAQKMAMLSRALYVTSVHKCNLQYYLQCFFHAFQMIKGSFVELCYRACRKLQKYKN